MKKKHSGKCIIPPHPLTKTVLPGVQGNSAISQQSKPRPCTGEATKPLIIAGNDMFGKKCHTRAACIFSKHLMRGCETVAAVHSVLVQGFPPLFLLLLLLLLLLQPGCAAPLTKAVSLEQWACAPGDPSRHSDAASLTFARGIHNPDYYYFILFFILAFSPL